MIFFFDIFRLEIGIFSSEHRRKETFWHWEYNRIKAKKTIVEIYETDYNHVQILELEKLQILYFNNVIFV